MRILKILFAFVFVIAILFGGYYGLYWYDLSNHTGTLELELDLSSPSQELSAPISLFPGNAIPLEVCARNLGYSDVSVRQTVTLSVYSAAGEPLWLDGSTWSAASLDIFSGSQDQEPCQTRVIRGNQAAYITEYRLGPAETQYALPFAQPTAGEPNATNTGFAVRLDAAASAEYANCIAVFDVFVEAALVDAPEQWQTVWTDSVIFGSDTTSLQHTVAEMPVSLERTTSFQWEILDGFAYLTGIGTVLEPDIVIPDQVSLSQTDGQYYEDPYAGTVYDVIVAGDAFYNCDSIVSATFSSGVQIENGEMHGKQGGMFGSCDALTAVDGIPDTVHSMKTTFACCASLTASPSLPASLTDLERCFKGCSSLRSVPDIPNGVTNMYSTFMDCVSLTEAPAFPDALVHLTSCFSGCSSLTEVPALPDTVTGLSRAFQDCISLIQAPVIPDSVTNLTECFSGCASLTEVPALPDGLKSLTGCFRDCVSLEKAPEIPDSVVTLKECFAGCSNLAVAPTIPDGVTDLFASFKNCVSLVSAPEIPDSVTDLRFCFSGCTSLSGIVTIPHFKPLDDESPYDFFRFQSIAGFLEGCTNVEAIHVRYCDGIIDAEKISGTIPVEFIGVHQTGTVCPVCRFANLTTEIDGVEVVIDNIPEESYLQFIDCFDNQAPDWLKAYCSRITFTDDLAKYNSKYAGNQYNGFATFPGGKAYIEDHYHYVGRNTNYTVFHELAHTFDHQYSRGALYSSSSEWKKIHSQEGDKAAEYWYGTSYNTMSLRKQRIETFAIAVGKYLAEPNALRRYCPKMYAYMEELFDKNQ